MSADTPLDYAVPRRRDRTPELRVATARRLTWVGLFLPIAAFVGAMEAFEASAKAGRDTRMGYEARRVGRMGVAAGVVNLLIIILSVGLCIQYLRYQDNLVHCSSNLRQIGLAIQMYAVERGGVLPPDFAAVALTQDITVDTFICPGSGDRPTALPENSTVAERAASVIEGTHACSYVYRAPTGVLASHLTARHVIAYEKTPGHGGGMNILFGDWHVEWIGKGQFEQIIAEVEAGQNPPSSVK